ncbi:WD domain, G-beta repeat [Aduncisulcus paluster]|uniref:WD domain, G-beta repeat n=1 Tax=Aduncisulcus paluster TaxID=2918883 RepID=A0ABQ5K4B1_9EUKA|nr:WD domain, G-beta repeat [Aduncisulcus paluster]
MKLKIENIVGMTFSKEYGTRCIATNPVDNTILAHTVGKRIILSSLGEASRQQALSGQENIISSICFSPCGQYLAAAEEPFSTQECYFTLWDYKKQRLLFRIKCHDGGISGLAFSPDSRFLATTGFSDQALCIWEVSSGEFIDAHSSSRKHYMSSLCWSPIMTGRHNRYTYNLFICEGSSPCLCTLQYDRSSLIHRLSTKYMSLPSAGVVRHYTSATFSKDGYEIICGTSSGEITVFSVDNAILRHIQKIGGSPVTSLILEGGCHPIPSSSSSPPPAQPSSPSSSVIVCGCFSGYVTCLEGRDKEWDVRGEEYIEGSIISLDSPHDTDEVIIACDNGLITTRAIPTLSDPFALCVHTVNTITCACDGLIEDSKAGDRSVVFIGEKRGCIRMCMGGVVVATIGRGAPASRRSRHGASSGVSHSTSASYPTAVSFSPITHNLWVGYNNGTIVIYNTSKAIKHVISSGSLEPIDDIVSINVILNIPDTHKGAVTALAVSEFGCISGGSDGVVRVWGESRGQCVCQYVVHSKTVTAVTWDVVVSSMIHSSSVDGTLCSYDIKNNRVVKTRNRGSMITDMAQVDGGECEVVTVDMKGIVSIYDFDCASAVVEKSLHDYDIRSVAISPCALYVAVLSRFGNLIMLSVDTGDVLQEIDTGSPGAVGLVWTREKNEKLWCIGEREACVVSVEHE